MGLIWPRSNCNILLTGKCSLIDGSSPPHLAKSSMFGVRTIFGSREGKGSNAHFHIIIQQEKGLETHSCSPLGVCVCM